MIGRVIEIASDGRYISLHRGFLVVRATGDGEADDIGPSTEIGRVPLDDVAAVIANAHGIVWTNNILVELARRGVPVVLCGAQHRPEAIVWPVDAHHAQAGRVADQAAATAPLKKRLWTQIVRAKILNQKALLAAIGARHEGFLLLARKVRSGDPENVEAEAARRYWPLLFGPDFRRDRDQEGTNVLLNYGYAVLRAGVARAVMAAGLHPSLGLMHRNRGNAMVLVDDLMEPFRPVVDREVWRLVRAGTTALNAETKATLARVMVIDLPTAIGLSPMMTCAERLAQSLARAYAGEELSLNLPLPRLPLE
jgi:CRISPR-associated protein Cas1